MVAFSLSSDRTMGRTVTPPPPKPLEALVDQIRGVESVLDQSIPLHKILAGQGPEFNPSRHLASQSTGIRQYTFSDLSLPLPASASSSVAATAPFPLYTPQSIPLLRRSLLNPSHITKTGAIFGPKTLIIRNTAAHSPFFRRMMTHPNVLRTLSAAAGVELEPVMHTMELGHANVQVDFSRYPSHLSAEEKMQLACQELTSDEFMARAYAGAGFSGAPAERSVDQIQRDVDSALLPWHYDSYPWVSVTMLSSTANMSGGETVIQDGTGALQGISQPGLGSTMLLQGGLVKHLALPSRSDVGDRITVITSYRARNPLVLDSSFMSNIRPYSDLQVLYHQWVSYRLSRLEAGLRQLQDRQRFVDSWDDAEEDSELRERVALREYAKRTLRQMVSPPIVQALVKRLGCGVFYEVRDRYVDGSLFAEARPCRACSGGYRLDKHHLTFCEGVRAWRPQSAIWEDWAHTKVVLEVEGAELEVRMEELQVKDVINAWRKEGRSWGIADEMAVQGLGEYLIELLEICGYTF